MVSLRAASGLLIKVLIRANCACIQAEKLVSAAIKCFKTTQSIKANTSNSTQHTHPYK